MKKEFHHRVNNSLAMLQGDLSSLKHVHQTTRSGHEQVATTIKVTHLVTDVGTSVDNAGADTRAISKLSGFIINLKQKMTF